MKAATAVKNLGSRRDPKGTSKGIHHTYKTTAADIIQASAWHVVRRRWVERTYLHEHDMDIRIMV